MVDTLQMSKSRESKNAERNNYVLVVFDSCRYDSFMRARPRTMRKLGPVERKVVVRLLDRAFAL